MTHLLEDAIAKVRILPPDAQDAVATLILAELADDTRWDEAFSRSAGKLTEFAGKVRRDIAAGRVRRGGFDDL